MNLGLVKTAESDINIIFQKAKAENHLSDYFKALFYKIQLLKSEKRFGVNTVVQEIEKEISEASIPRKQVLYSILAEVYLNHYNNKQWEINKRTNVSDVANSNIETWTIKNFKNIIWKYYLASLKNSNKLALHKIDELDEVLEGDSATREYRPTVYDLLAYRTINYFNNYDNNIANHKIRDDKKLDYFLPANSFLELTIDTLKQTHHSYTLLKIFQNLLKVHKENHNTVAFIGADLERLKFVRHHFLSGEKNELLYLHALNSIITAFPKHPSLAEVQYEKALVYTNQAKRYDPFVKNEYRWRNKKALEICNMVLKKFPHSLGTKYCKDMKKSLESPFIKINLKEVQLPKTPILASLTYKNVNRLYFRLFKLNFDKNQRLQEKQRLAKQLDSYLKETPVEEWLQNIPDKGDMIRHTLNIRIPELQKGYYILLTSTTPDFEKKKLIQLNYFWVSELSFISRNDGKGGLDIFVLNRNNGTPMQNVKLEISNKIYDYKLQINKTEKIEELISNKYGYAHLFSKKNKNNYQIAFVYNNDTLVEENVNMPYYSDRNKKARIETQFFLDRKIYQPGQTLYFKGIVLEKENNEFKIVENHKSKVRFYDVNNRIISTLELISNEFGSFNGSFIIPQGILNGNMRLQSNQSRVSFVVEDYKRPSFEIQFDTIREQYRLNDSVTLSANVKTFSGSNLNNAKVKYILKRFKYSFYKYYDNVETQLLSGESITDENGKFEFTFLTEAESGLKDQKDVVYNYVLSLDVTDLNGETQSAQKNISVSTTNLKLYSTVAENLEKNTTKIIPITATNFNNQKQIVNISVSIFEVKNPDRAFKPRLGKRPDQFVMDSATFYNYFPNDIFDDELNSDNWKIKDQVYQAEINTDEVEGIEIFDLRNWKEGVYKIVLKARDQFDEEVEFSKLFTLYSADSKKLPLAKFNWFELLKNKFVPGDTCSFVIGSYAKNVSVLYEFHHKGKVVLNKRVQLNYEQKKIEIPITKELIGELTLNIIFVYDNEMYSKKENIIVNNPEKKLNIHLETFRSVLKPGTKEKWKLKISGSKGEAVNAELLSTMYDASLDKVKANSWQLNLRQVFYNYIVWNGRYGFEKAKRRMLNYKTYGFYYSDIQKNYEIIPFNFYYQDRIVHYGLKKRLLTGSIQEGIAGINMEKKLNEIVVLDFEESAIFKSKQLNISNVINPEIKIRKNFNETSFFYPDLKTDKEGNIILNFTSPKSLSRWKFMALVHTKDLRNTYLEEEVITQKELMVSPNIPRFFRQGDTLYFTTKIINLTDEVGKGNVKLQLFNAENMQELDTVITDTNNIINFKINPNSSVTKSWKLVIPDDVNAITYRLIASTEKHSDGEERMIPVLSNRKLVTESLPIYLNPYQSKKINFERLLNARNQKSLKHHKLKLEVTSNPNWYAIQALPAIADNKEENSIAIFNRFYVHSIAKHILNSNPIIKQVFEQWKKVSPNAFLSKLEKNQKLKSILLEETPWFIEAKNDSEKMRRLTQYFDLNTINQKLEKDLNKLLELQLPDGSWTWFKGGRGNRYITQNILIGLERLKYHKILDEDQFSKVQDAIINAISFLNYKLIEDFEDMKKQKTIILDDDHLQSIHIQYLFALSYENYNQKNDKKLEKVLAYYLTQAQKYWMNKNNYMQGMIALILYRNADIETSTTIIKSLKERAVMDDELGMYWNQQPGYYWYQSPIETHALLIEVFKELNTNQKNVTGLKKYLLKQKQTQLWSTTKASVDAVYALLLNEADVLTNTQPIQVNLGDKTIRPDKKEATTFYYEKSWSEAEIKQEMEEVQLKNPNKQIAWGALYWQYFEYLDKISSFETPLKIEKKLFIKQANDNGMVLVPLDENNSIKVGDKIVSRIIVSVDRNMEFVHLKDMRASALEPINIFSSYRYQNGLGYYESTKDVATHFYFDQLREGTYVFEYEMFASQKGEFSNGISTIQCLYAPEFFNHSEGLRIRVE
jgi:hypothetical protein